MSPPMQFQYTGVFSSIGESSGNVLICFHPSAIPICSSNTNGPLTFIVNHEKSDADNERSCHQGACGMRGFNKPTSSSEHILISIFSGKTPERSIHVGKIDGFRWQWPYNDIEDQSIGVEIAMFLHARHTWHSRSGICVLRG